MEHPIRNHWWTRDIPEHIDLNLPGIYAWRIGPDSVYIGKSARLGARILEYPNNVRKMIAGEPYRKGQPTAFREVHRALRLAHDTGRNVSVTVLENCEKASLSQRERYWIATTRAEAERRGLRVLNATTQGTKMAHTTYCWRCKVALPMLDEDEWAKISPLLSQAIEPGNEQEALDLYAQITGLRETNINAVFHHRRAIYGPLCSECDKPLRTPLAKFCAACGASAT